MKKLINSIIVILLCVTTSQVKAKDPYHLIVEGEFLHKKNISYTVFQEDQKGNFVSIEHVKARKYYHVECNTGHRYIIRFQNKKGNVKFLMIDAVQRGYFIADVADQLGKKGYLPAWWTRGTDYTDTKLREAKIFVLMSEHNQFDYRLDNMTLGCRKELALAQSLNKPLYIAYWKRGKTLNIYPIVMKHLEDGRVLGQSGCYLRDADKVIDNYSIY
ncbi:MAG: hypothetical protein E6R13_08230 [Spirochaetes bacterium]|nr:MAG: hypothetical protein E6R13_08230 [Spirochaetota bacterium]